MLVFLCLGLLIRLCKIRGAAFVFYVFVGSCRDIGLFALMIVFDKWKSTVGTTSIHDGVVVVLWRVYYICQSRSF